jgi:hypothetical protein
MIGEIMAVTNTEDRGTFAMSTEGIIATGVGMTDVGTENEDMTMMVLRDSIYRRLHRLASVSFFHPSLFTRRGYCLVLTVQPSS